jgi:hypothetical protein
MSDIKDSKKLREIFIDATSDSSLTVEDQLESVLKKSTTTSSFGSFQPLMKNVPVSEEHTKKDKGVKLAFYTDPVESSDYSGLFKIKRKLIPDHIIKVIRIQNHLVASILRARGNTMAMHGNKRRDRFDIGFEVQIKPEFEKYVKPEQLEKIQDRISKFEKILLNCGHVEGVEHHDKMSLSQFLEVQAQNGLSFGRFGTEIVYDRDEKSKKFHSFRPVDVATIYNTAPRAGNAADGIREASIKRLKQLLNPTQGDKVEVKNIEEDNYSYVQVIDGVPLQAFTHEEMVVYNLFPSTDVEHAGYPITPIDTCLSSITTHLSIDAYNRLYFQNGRAAKGILVIKSEDIDQNVVAKIRQDFMASINSVNNAFRAPVFGIGLEDDVEWKPMVSNAGDGEFQFLYDQVARNILSTFNMSPDELPGYGHLSRGTGQQSLSESNNEFKLTAARDTGIRPMILKFQSYFNEKLFPIIDPELSQICYVQFAGLDAQTKDQEALRLQQDMPIHMTYDEVMTSVGKDQLGDRLGGSFPLNERWQIVVDKMLKVSEQREAFLKDPAALFDPLLQFNRDPFYIQHISILMQVNPDAVKALYATKPYAFDLLKTFILDLTEEE